MIRFFQKVLSPTSITITVLVILIGGLLISSGGDPLIFAQIGTRYSQGISDGSEGYDGQFNYFLARDLYPRSVKIHLDIPAYRYQRILLPFLANILSFGDLRLVPWLLVLICLTAHAVGVFLLEKLIVLWGGNRWYALPYGLWVGFLLAVRQDLSETLAYALVLGALYASHRTKTGMSWILLGLALFAKEVTIFFVLAAFLDNLMGQGLRRSFGFIMIVFGPYIIFQAWLFWIFGQPGIASGGEMATPFEIIPFMGLFRIILYSIPYFLAMLIVFGPAVILPSCWGILTGCKAILTGNKNVLVFSLLFNSAGIAILPFSTFRETGGILRVVCGLVLAVILFAVRYRQTRVLNYSLFWMVFNVFLFKS